MNVPKTVRNFVTQWAAIDVYMS